MSIADFGEALRTGLKGRTLDAVYFRSCLMGNVEALYEIKGSVSYAIASEQVSSSVANSNLTMSEMFQSLAAKNTPPDVLAREVAIQAHAKSNRLPNGRRGGYDTIIAADVSKVGDLKSSLNSLVIQLKGAMGTEREAILAAYDAVHKFDGHGGDLWAFTRELQTRVKDPGVLAAVRQTRAAQRAVMLHERDDMGGDAGGLSILMPARDAIAPTMKGIGYASTRFAKDSNWAEFLLSVAEAPKPEPAPAPPPG